MLAHARHLFAAHVTDDLPRWSSTEPVAGAVVVRDATLVCSHDTAGRRNVTCSLRSALLYAISSPVLSLLAVHKDFNRAAFNIGYARSFIAFISRLRSRPTETFQPLFVK